MIKWFKRNQDTSTSESAPEGALNPSTQDEINDTERAAKKSAEKHH